MNEQTSTPVIQLKELSPRHKQAMSLLAQGLPRQTIAAVVDYTPEYITWLARQPLCIEYLKEMNEAVDARLHALFDKSVDVIAETLINGSEKGRLSAAKLQLEATHRIGPERGDAPQRGDDDRLERLAERLTGLLASKQGNTIPGQYREIDDDNLLAVDK